MIVMKIGPLKPPENPKQKPEDYPTILGPLGSPHSGPLWTTGPFRTPHSYQANLNTAGAASRPWGHSSCLAYPNAERTNHAYHKAASAQY